MAFMDSRAVAAYARHAMPGRTPPPYRDLSTVLREAGFLGASDASLSAVRSRVLHALAAFRDGATSRLQAERAERQYAIITRCDLGGELHKVVAADLAISMRTFYRERFDGFERLRMALSAAPDEAAAPVPDGLYERFERAWDCVWVGRLRDASVRLEELTASAPPALASIAFARLSSVRLMQGDDDGAEQALAKARRALAILGPWKAGAVARAEIRVVDAQRLVEAGALGHAALAFERICDEFDGSTSEAPECARHALVGLAFARVARGDARAALDALAARERLVAQARRSAPLCAILDVLSAESALILGGNAHEVLERSMRAQLAASQSGAILVAVRALLVAAQASFVLLDSAGALSHVRAARSIARERPGGRIGTAIRLAVAGALVELGDPEEAMSLVAECGIHEGREDFTAGVARSREAAALAELGQSSEAVRRGREAMRILSRCDSHRALGEAIAATAQATHGCGDARTARVLAVRATKLLWGATWPTRVSSTLRLAGRRRIWRRGSAPAASDERLGA